MKMNHEELVTLVESLESNQILRVLIEEDRIDIVTINRDSKYQVISCYYDNEENELQIVEDDDSEYLETLLRKMSLAV